MPERATPRVRWSEESAEAIVVKGETEAKGRTWRLPTVLDRLIQQALLQVLQPEIDLRFSKHSYGFRPGRNAHAAVKAARAYVQSGRRFVVDMDLEKFFDRLRWLPRPGWRSSRGGPRGRPARSERPGTHKGCPYASGEGPPMAQGQAARCQVVWQGPPGITRSPYADCAARNLAPPVHQGEASRSNERRSV